MRKLLRTLLLPSLISISLAQNPSAPDPKTQAAQQKMRDTLKDAQSAGVVLNSSSNVQDSVNVEAVMLPNSIVRSVFGKVVADNYAVIEVNVSNRNPDAAFILGSLYIDYSKWGLANGTGDFVPPNPSLGYVRASDSRQVSSVEYRIIRGELLDRQPYTKRNITIRSMKVLGSIGTAFAFPFSTDVVKGIGAWNGGVVPGFDELFPDGTTAQMNRISDYGFRDNKVIPQQSADIVIAFFPVKRFLSPTLERIFKKSPALFFDPLLLAIDPKTRPGIERLLENALGKKEDVDAALTALLKIIASTDVDELNAIETKVQAIKAKIATDRREVESLNKDVSTLKDADSRARRSAALGDATVDLNLDIKDLKEAQDALKSIFSDAPGQKMPGANAAALYLFLNQISLSRVSVVVGGTMNVDEQIIPASISETCFDPPAPELWAVPGTKTCTIHGRFLLHGTPKFKADGPDLGISNIEVQESSSSDSLTFTYSLKQAIDPPKFTLTVTKEGKNKTGVDSTPYQVTSTMMLPSPVIDSIALGADNKSVIVSGKNFFSVQKDHALTVSLSPVKAGAETSMEPATPDSATKITLPEAFLQKPPAGCYKLVVKVGSDPASFKKPEFVEIDSPKAGEKEKAISIPDRCPAS